MNRKIMDGLSYGFYFIIICLIFLVVYLFFFKSDKPKKNNKVDDDTPSEVVSENIKLNKTELSLDIGEKFALKVTLIPSNGKEIIKYTSSDESVAIVSENGEVKGVGAGSTVIVVTVEGTDLKTECKVDVSNDTIIAQDLFVQNERVKIKIGETYQINVTVVPSDAVDKSLIYKSLNDKVLTVSEDGLVTALSKGRTMVEIQAKSNPDIKIKVDFTIS